MKTLFLVLFAAVLSATAISAVPVGGNFVKGAAEEAATAMETEVSMEHGTLYDLSSRFANLNPLGTSPAGKRLGSATFMYPKPATPPGPSRFAPSHSGTNMRAQLYTIHETEPANVDIHASSSGKREPPYDMDGYASSSQRRRY